MRDKNDPFSIFNKDYDPNWVSLLKFEVISFVGRIFKRKPPKVSDKNYLNLGCGDSYIDGWVNSDFFRVRFWIVPKSGWSEDYRFPLKCDNDYWDGVFTEHTLEHLHPLEVKNLLKELYRTMKPGAWLRVVVPGLDQHIMPFIKDEKDNQIIKEFGTLAESVRSLTQNWGHRSVWNGELFSIMLKDAGFQNIKQVDYMVGSCPDIIKDNIERKYESLYMEGQKP